MNFLFRSVGPASVVVLLWLAAGQTFIKAEDTVLINNNNPFPRVARISLESKGLDLGDKFHDETLALLNQAPHESERSTNSTGTGTGASGRKKSKKPERAGRRLSNIWSMFLPSSASSNEDYEDPASEANGEESTAVADNNASSNRDPKNATVEVVDQSSASRKEANSVAPDNHEEKLVAKYARPVKWDSQHPVEPSLAVAQRVAASTANQTTSLHSVPLMASASSIRSQAADMNDIMSNIMNSMSSKSSANFHRVPTAGFASPGDSIEREDDGSSSDGLVANKTKEGDQFERWLNKIKFRESEREFAVNSPTNLTNSSNKLIQEADSARLDHPKKVDSVGQGRVSFSSDRKQEHSFGATKTSLHQGRAPPVKAPVHQFARLRQSPGQQVAAVNKLPLQRPSVSSFNQPYAQASTATIEINADDNSTAGIKPANITSSLTEVTSEQSILQSQDEILKQVTNAINFEQQQLNSRRENTLKSSLAQEDSAPNQDEDPHLNGFKLFRVGTSMNELINGSDRPPTESSLVPSNKTNSSKLTNNEISKSSPQGKSASNETDIPETIKASTEKLRPTGGPQTSVPEKQLSSDQPMWLQHNLHLNNNHLLMVKDNQPKLAHPPADEGGSSKLDKSQLGHLKELVERHEKTKNELKSSQESMYKFLRQFMGADASEKLLASQGATSLLGGILNGSLGAQRTAAQAHPAGWTPMTLAHQEPMVHISPDRLHGKFRGAHAMRISQLKDNIGQGEDLLDKDNYLNELSGFYKEFQSNPSFHHHDPLDSLHPGTFGTGKGEVNDDESLQLEQAAHQVLGGGYNKNLISRPRFKVDPRPDLSQQKLVSLAESMLDDSKMGSKFPPRLYPMGGKKRQNGLAHGGYVNLMQTTDQESANQPPERPHHQVEESLGSQDPMSLQTSKVSSETSESLRQKDSTTALAATRTRLAPQMLAQLNLPGVPPAKIQLSLDGIPNQTPIVSAKLRLPSPFSGTGLTGSFVTPDMAHDVGLRAPIVAASAPANNLPVRFREVSIYRPFGYESHHAIAYQASPAIAALFPGFAQSSRPSMLRHMTPFRAIQTQRGLINPIMPAFQVIDNTGRGNAGSQSAADQFQQTASMSSQSLPVNGVSRIRPGFRGQLAASYPLRRQSHWIRPLNNKWSTMAINPLSADPNLTQTMMKIRRNTVENRPDRAHGFAPALGRNGPSINSRHAHTSRATRYTIH